MKKKNKAEHFVVWGSTKDGMSCRSDKVTKNNKAYLKKICSKMSKEERACFGKAILENAGSKIRLKGVR